MHRLLLLFLPLFLFPVSATPDCPFYGYRFLNPRVIDYDSRLSPFFVHFGSSYSSLLDQPAGLAKRDNLAEWHERYCEQVELEDLETVIYGPTLNSLERLARTLEDKQATTADVPAGLRGNSFAEHLIDYKCTEVVDYLIFAKRAEPHVVAPPRSFEKTARQVTEMRDLIDQGLDVFPSVESHYVRLRYAFQLVRLAHYIGANDYVIELYDYLMPKIEADPSLLYDWIEAHRAGAMQRQGKYAESAYLFSRIFERCPSRRQAAYASFRIKTNEQWARANLLCANDHERAMLHVLRAHNGRAVVLEEVRDIYRLDPANRSLPLLVMRELQELERDLMGLDFNPEKRANQRLLQRPRPGAPERLIAFQGFVNVVLNEGRVTDTDFWLLARGVLEMLAGDYFFARESFDKLANQTSNDTIIDQLAILNEVTDLLALSRINDSIENHYFEVLNGDIRRQYPDIKPMVNDKFEALYRRNGQVAKAALLQYGFDAIQKNPELGYISELRRIADSTNTNRFDRSLLNNRMGPFPQDDLNHLLGLHYLQRGQWEAALDYFRQIPTARRAEYGRFAPFVKQFEDRVNYRPDPATNGTFDKVELFENLFSLEEIARRTTNDTLASQNYFRMGLAFYNMSYFGYAWNIADEFRSGTSAAIAARNYQPYYTFPNPSSPLGNQENMNMRLAQDYFERALSRAYSREVAAEALYWLAKTERNEFYANGSPGRVRPLRYLSQLRQVYPDTRYYERVVAECKTFAWFVNR